MTTMVFMMQLLFWLLGSLDCAVDAFVVGERNADARVSTVYHFSNDTVGDAPVEPYLGNTCSSSSLLTVPTSVGRKLIHPIQRQDLGHSNQPTSSLASRPNHPFRRACARVRTCRQRTGDRRVCFRRLCSSKCRPLAEYGDPTY